MIDPVGRKSDADLRRNIFLGAAVYEGGVTLAPDVQVQEVSEMEFGYPKQFNNPPPFPLSDGTYRVEWWGLRDLGHALLAKDEFEIKRGSLIR